MTSTRSAIVLGASGSVGQALIAELLRRNAFARIVTLTRRSQPALLAMARAAGTELHEVLVPEMTPDALYSATLATARAADDGAVGLSVLGVGAGTATLTIEQHRAVDVQLNTAFARALKDSDRVPHFAFMSAVGANPAAAATGSGAAGGGRYNRVKGEAEESVKAVGPAVVSIFRPAMIIGSSHTPWLLEKLLPMLSFVTPARLRSITVSQIARAMVASSVQVPAASAVYHFTEMVVLGAPGAW